MKKNGLILLQGHSANQNAGTKKMLLPSGEEGCSPNDAGFPDITKTTSWRRRLLSQWECRISRHNKNHMLPKCDTMLTADKALLVSYSQLLFISINTLIKVLIWFKCLIKVLIWFKGLTKVLLWFKSELQKEYPF